MKEKKFRISLTMVRAVILGRKRRLRREGWHISKILALKQKIVSFKLARAT